MPPASGCCGNACWRCRPSGRRGGGGSRGGRVRTEPAWMSPKPLQKPYPPVLLGGETDHTLKRVVEFCDDWFPRAGAGFDPAVAVGRLRAAAEAAGRDPATLSITVFRAPPEAAALARYREAGIRRVLLEVPDL